jgi:hypothetical protein
LSAIEIDTRPWLEVVEMMILSPPYLGRGCVVQQVCHRTSGGRDAGCVDLNLRCILTRGAFQELGEAEDDGRGGAQVACQHHGEVLQRLAHGLLVVFQVVGMSDVLNGPGASRFPSTWFEDRLALHHGDGSAARIGDI